MFTFLQQSDFYKYFLDHVHRNSSQSSRVTHPHGHSLVLRSWWMTQTQLTHFILTYPVRIKLYANMKNTILLRKNYWWIMEKRNFFKKLMNAVWEIRLRTAFRFEQVYLQAIFRNLCECKFWSKYWSHAFHVQHVPGDWRAINAIVFGMAWQRPSPRIKVPTRFHSWFSLSKCLWPTAFDF